MFEFKKAIKEDFYKFYTLYQVKKYNVWFPNSIEDSVSLYVKFFKKEVYWVYSSGKKIGGVAIDKNWFGLVFVIPPFNDEYLFLSEIVKHVTKISDTSKPISAFGMVPKHVNLLQQLGFQLIETEKDMICATDNYDISYPTDIYAEKPTKSILKELVDFYYQVYKLSKVESLSDKSYEFYEELLTSQIDSIDSNFSTVLRSKDTDEIVGICTSEIWFGLPSILDVLVKPTYQKRGLAKLMIKHVLNTACDKEYPAVTLSVVPGNSAENLYYKLGFMNLSSSSSLKLYL